LQKHSPKASTIWVNWPPPSSRPAEANFAPDKRIVQFLADREVRFIPGAGVVHAPSDRAALEAYFAQVAGDWAIVYYDGIGWPAFHAPRTAHRANGPPWCHLSHRHRSSGEFDPVECPVDRGYVRDTPG